ncbi:helix-turn-helix transcriptional regulator [Tahibacter soli]|uniref:Helix-turn-helix transcriptional regulator n=1 Tax=Tahibacter soli TaxID=2983605 RepID=A0A9X4BH37_9GAMM|nr:helix-turn-helix transcriptional regulator [Tahibacter soli]MDC8012326.1 helix-turn-helix transcriptional regulator [Tahibacter soli]
MTLPNAEPERNTPPAPYDRRPPTAADRLVLPDTAFDLAAASASFGVTALSAALACAAGDGRAGRSLAAFFLCLAASTFVGMVMVGADTSLGAAGIRWARTINIPAAYLLGPLLYRYVVTLLAGPRAMPPILRSWHVLPAALGLAFALANAIGALDETPLGAAVHLFVFHAWVLQGVAYLVLAALRLRGTRAALEEVSADEANLRLAWLRVLVPVFGALWLVLGADRLFTALAAERWRLFGFALGWATVFAVYALAWFGLRQRMLMPAELAPHYAPGAAPPPDAAKDARYERSGLSTAELAQIAADLERVVRDERLYADSALDLASLSDRSGWPPNYISQALNQALGRNFFEFVNGFRIREAARCLADPADGRAILDIAMACGFGSKSTFNTVFKRMTGATPSDYRRRAFEPAGSDV